LGRHRAMQQATGHRRGLLAAGSLPHSFNPRSI